MILNFLLFNLFILLFFLIRDIIKYNINFSEFKERLGINTLKCRNYDYLIHGASCGELQSIIPIIKILKNKNKNFLISGWTPSGVRLLKKKGINNTILKPYETFINIFFFILNYKFKKLIIIESDIWPIFIIIIKLLRIKIIAINYKKKEKKKLRNILHNLLIDKIFLKNNINISDYLSKYEFLGNTKLLNVKTDLIELPKKNNIITIVSAHENEFFIHKKIIKYCIDNNVKIIYIPRYLSDNLSNKHKFKDFNYYLLDKQTINFDNIVNNNNLIVCNLYGIVQLALSVSKICIMGGTYNNVGCHNLVEPIINKCLIIMGPSFHTQKDMFDVLNIEKCIYICSNYKIIINTLKILLLSDSENKINNTINYLKKYNINIKKKLELAL